METNARDKNLRVSCPVISSSKNIQFLEHLKNYSCNKGNLIKKFTPIYIAELIPISQLEQWSILFVGPDSKISEEEFIALFGSAVPHGRYQTLFLILSLREIYKEIKAKQKVGINEQNIQFNCITDFLCEKITNNQQDARLQIRASQQYQQISNVRNYPPIKYLFAQSLPFICKEGVNKQKSLTNNLNKLQYSPKMGKIISLAAIDNKVELYDLDLKLKDNISIDIGKQIIIISFAFSQEHQRICCLIHNFGLVFWQASDNFETKIIISGVKADFVFYLPQGEFWGSVKANTISIWNIEQEKQHYCINIPEASQVCCLEQLPHLRLTLVSIILKTKKRQLRIYSINNQKARNLSKIQIANSGCHTLLVNFATQSILQVGYSNNIRVWECDNLTFELMSLGELVGHRSIVISATNIGLSSIVATGDDKGHIKLWDLKHLRCYQTIRVSTKQIYQLINIQNLLVYGDNRISILHLDQKKNEKVDGFYTTSFYDQRMEKNYLFTQDSCSVIDMATGEVEQIFIICEVDQQIVAVQRLKNSFFIATNRGNIINTDLQFKRKKIIKINECGIINLISVPINNCLLMTTSDGCLSVWISDFSNESLQLRKTLSHFPIRKLSPNSIFQVSAKNYLLSFCLNDHQIFVTDFQLFKFQYKLVFPANVTAFKFHSNYDILIVCCEDKQIYIIKFQKIQREYRIGRVLSNSCQFFSITQNQNCKQYKSQYICKIVINKIGQLICGTNLGTVQIYDLQKYLKQVQMQLKTAQGIKKSDVNIFRPTSQSFQNIQKLQLAKSIQIAKIRECLNNPIPLLISKPHIANWKQIIYLDDSRDIGMITVISSDGVIRLLDFKSLQVVCMRKYCQRSPSCWKQPNIDDKILKNSITDIIKLAENIYNKRYRPSIEKYIDIQKLNICMFLSALATLQLDSVEKMPELFNLNTKKNHVKHKSVFQDSNGKFKAMQAEKRVRKKSCILNNHTESESGIINRRFKQTAAILQRKQNPIHDQFYKKSLASKILEERQTKLDEQCIIYDKINQKFQKWKQEKKSRSLTSFSNVGSSSLSKQQGIRDSEKCSIKTKDSDTKNILISKIEKLYYKSDKKSEALQKLFKKKCSHLFDKMR